MSHLESSESVAAQDGIVALYRRTLGEVEKVVYGQEETVAYCLAALFSNGHVLIEGVPGTAKTTLVRTIASALSLEFSRVQFTPDLLPNDITGSYVFRAQSGEFNFRKGPIFANFVLADEINRAPAKTQSALLEAMQEATVTQESTSHALPQPFVVFATQNPIEHEGTYPLPLAQLDRFMFKVLVGYPSPEAEEQVLTRHHATPERDALQAFDVRKAATREEVLAARTTIRETFVRPEVVRYVRGLIGATRDDTNLLVGASPRAGLNLLMGAKSLARFDGRDFVTPDDIKSAFLPALRHRVVLSPSSELEGVSVDDALRRILNAVEVPR
ncbi:MAG: MoxR family ATPase [FCB group bacterium]|jgi:MoxR-like ATPase|nr:MoxR family ATPase [FCB group bacterium]